MGSFDIWTILIFSLVVFFTGISFARTGKDIKSFFAAGGAVPWWISGLSLYMSFFSAGTFVVWGSIAYTNGLVSITIQWTMCIAGLIIGFFIAPRWNKTRVITAAEYISQRLGFKTQKLYTYLFLVISMFTTGAFLYPVAKIVEVSTGIPIYVNIIVLGVLITIYNAVGGLWAVIVTDVLQFIVLTSAVLIVVPLAVSKIGGLETFVSSAPDGFFNLFDEKYSPGFMLAFGLYNMVFLGGNWAYVQRYTSVENPQMAKRVGWLFGALYFISPVIWMVPPMIYRVMNPSLEGLADEGAYLMICKEVLPKGLLGLMLGAMIFATSSSVNAILNISSGVFTNDIFRRLYPKSTDRITMIAARSATSFFGVLTIIVALLVPRMGGIVEVVLSVGAITGGAMFLPPIWSLFSKRQTGWSILSTTIVSLLINLFFKLVAPATLNISLSRADEMILGVAIPIVFLLGYEIYFAVKAKEDPQYQKYLRLETARNEATASDIELENTGTSNLRGRRIIATGISVIALLILGLGLLTDFAGGMIITISILIGFVAFLIWPKEFNYSFTKKRK